MEYSVQMNGQMASQPGHADGDRQTSSDKPKDGSEILPPLAKLKGLQKDDKTENAMLRSRIDEQSQLIMILKTRADEAIVRTQTLERINKDLEDFRNNANDQLNHEIRKYNLLDGRFDTLASNHEELIKFKDEYKRVNVELRVENEKLRDENGRLFSKAINEKDDVIRTMEGRLAAVKEQYSALEKEHRHSLQESRSREEELRKDMKTLQDKLKADMKSLQAKLTDTEERLKGVNYKLQNVQDSKQSASAESQQRIQDLTREKDELLNLAMSRGKIIQRDQTENKTLQKKIAAMEKAVRDMEEKFEREVASVNSNIQVRKLKKDLEETDFRSSEVTKEFDAYKKHTTALLKKEKELNERLRHLVG